MHHRSPISSDAVITAPFVVDGAMDCRKFDIYVRTQLAPTLKPGDVVILTTPKEIDLGLTAPWSEAKVLQRPLADEQLVKLVA